MARYPVALRGGFADRNKIKEENTTMQIHNFDSRTRVALINMTDLIIHSYFPNIDRSHLNGSKYTFEQDFLKNLLADVYSHVVTRSSTVSYESVWVIIKDTLSTDDYASVLTIIEYITQTVSNQPYYNVFYKENTYTAEQAYNLVMRQEYMGYRLINNEARPITDDNEVQAIQESMDSKYTEVAQHFSKALSFLSDRQAPDYANSIKESISAVERMCSIIIGKSTVLSDAFRKLESSGVKIHPALKGAFTQLYGYTSDASGIRHSGQLLRQSLHWLHRHLVRMRQHTTLQRFQPYCIGCNHLVCMILLQR